MQGRDTPPGEGDSLTTEARAGNDDSDVDWAGLARDAYNSSTNWINASRRSAWGDSLRQFQGKHASGSKYHSVDFRYRSKLFRPKTRSMVRKAEAGSAQAFFSTAQVVSIDAENEDDAAQLASARLKQELLNYRLTRSIKWFMTVQAAKQDCMVYGFCVSRQFWKWEERLIATRRRMPDGTLAEADAGDEEGMTAPDTYNFYEVVADHPMVELIAPDNFRFDPAADWLDPVNSSPYLIQRVPMYVGDILMKMQAPPGEVPEWYPLDVGTIVASNTTSDDATRLTRDGNRQDPRQSQAQKSSELDVAWVHLVTMKRRGIDYVYWTLQSGTLLSKPRPHIEVYGTDQRPYVLGIDNLEAHRNYPASNIELTKDLQSQANETVNLRLDSLKMALQPRPKVLAASPAATNLTDFRIVAPGKPIMVNQADDVTWDTPPDVSGSALAEQDRINQDFDELSGSFSQASVGTANNLNETVGGMELIAGAAGSIGELQLEYFKFTWVIPVIEQLLDLEERLEEDEMVLALAGARAKLVQQYGINQVDDWLMSQKVTAKVDVGIGATNPKMRLGNLKTAAEIIKGLFGDAAGAGLVWDETCAEVFGALGFSDGKRFFVPGFDPHLAAQQMAQPPIGVDPNKMQEVQATNQTKVQVAEIQADAAVKVAAMKNTPAGVSFHPEELNLEQVKLQNAMQIAGLKADSQERIAMMNLARERQAQAAETQRALIDARTKEAGHVIRAYPALAKVLSDHHIGLRQVNQRSATGG